MMGLMIFAVALAVATGSGVYLAERVDRPRRRAMHAARLLPAE
ncbi:MAG: hypothetical protein ABIR08_11460 [Sphingomonas sp.]